MATFVGFGLILGRFWQMLADFGVLLVDFWRIFFCISWVPQVWTFQTCKKVGAMSSTGRVTGTFGGFWLILANFCSFGQLWLIF
jgi:hypothetical protein